MRIGVESSILIRRQKTGVAFYGYNLLRALASAAPDDQLFLCYMQFLGKAGIDLGIKSPNTYPRRIRFFPSKLYNALDHFAVPPPIDLLAMLRTDVFLFPNFFIWPLWLTRRSVVVVHDLSYIETPEFLVARNRKYLSRRVPQSARRATHVIAISENTKQELIRHHNIDPHKISVILPAIDHTKYRPANNSQMEAVRKKYGITKDYLLYFGTIEPRKNIAGILGAYKLLPKALQGKYQLVLAGGKGWLDQEIESLATTMPTGSLVRTGYVDEGDEPLLYNGATLFVFPSHYEGWGMPIIEAMACGTPVLTARNSSLPEAGGAAASYIDSPDAESISNRIVSLLADPKKLTEMKAAGLAHVKQFTWEASAHKLHQVLHNVVNSSKQPK